ncbi:hypothetical protein N9850_01595 [Granulosicoccus sp.]|nr:hypothetical protein [Granulosicoccus sp.]MDB4222435.1 hypothetical protein [Granulosicoccus sp.]
MSSHETINVESPSAIGEIPTLDEMKVAYLTQQKLIEEKNVEIRNKQAWIEVLEEKLRLADQRKFGASSEKNLSQKDWLADEAETLADGQSDPNDGEIDPEADSESADKKPARKRRKGLNPALPRVQKYVHLSDEEREGALETFFVKVKEELDIIPSKVQVIEIMQEKAVYLDDDGERFLKAAARPAHPAGKSIASVQLLAWIIIAKYAAV